MAGLAADPTTAKSPRPEVPWRPDEERPRPLPADSSPDLAVDISHGRSPHLGRRLIGEWSVCWLISAIVNLLILLAAALFLLPFQRAGGSLTLIASTDAEEGDLETLMSESADTASLDFGVELQVSQPELIDPQDVRVELDVASGTLGEGPGGWQGGAGSGGSGSGTDYFGTVAYGFRFVYILDKSTSMNWGRSGQANSNSRFDRARYELLRSIDKLAPYQSFYVILFSTTTRRMFDDESPSPVTIPATRENKQRLRQWLEAADVGGGTDPREALVVALSIAPDAIFLLSDGDFNSVSGRRSPLFAGTPEAEELVQQIHRGYTPIHTFAYEDPESKRRMETLAQITGGEYKYIPPNEQERPKPAPPRRRRR